MAYNNYIPQFYPQQDYSRAAYIPQTQNNPQNAITWVQGENAAKSYPIGAGQSILLMDSENPIMYIKSTDQSGMPLPLRVFDYKERIVTSVDNSQSEEKIEYVTKEEFNKLRDDIKELIKSQRQNNYRKPNKED